MNELYYIIIFHVVPQLFLDKMKKKKALNDLPKVGMKNKRGNSL